MKITFNSKNKKIALDARKCSFFEMFMGLMFRRREKAPALLLFDFKKPRRMKIHSMFVFFPFAAVWLDDKNNIVEKRLIKPWTFSVLPKKKFNRLAEIPLNRKYDCILKQLRIPRR